MNATPCPQCSSRDVYRSKKTVSSGGGHAPEHLPGLGTWSKTAQMRVYVCRACGLMRYFAEPEARQKISESDKWERA